MKITLAVAAFIGLIQAKSNNSTVPVWDLNSVKAHNADTDNYSWSATN